MSFTFSSFDMHTNQKCRIRSRRGSQPISFCNANDTTEGLVNLKFTTIKVNEIQKTITNGSKSKLFLVSEEKVKKSIKSIYSVKHLQLRNSKKSSSDFSSSSGSDEVDEEIKFNLLSISICKHYYQSLCFVLHTYTPYSQRESEKITSSNYYILNESSLSFEVSSSLHDATHKNLINRNVFMNGGSLNLNDLSSCVPEVAPLKLSEEEYAYYAIKINYSFIVNQLPLEL
ncbi:unnamed protein product [Rhizophagus irregularis]|uniref:Uncharacterized protein n=1 Tax=Rhizophagus irregularis TaxID=588596 RepID=A0A916E723_9GLOM|nr:unnamed protein product [Rhizophagus irregularis]CAB5367416.1 unnamed protein product [Rhizophagus irregularis]